MNAQVFGCPNCNQPFQVLAEQAGQIVQCPSCAQTVEIPASSFASATDANATRFSPQPSPSSSIQQKIPDQVCTCQHCHGQFGVTKEMFGLRVACPHCQNALEIPSAATEATGFETPVVEIENVKSDSRRKRKQASISPTHSDSETSARSQDLFPPGFVGNARPDASQQAPVPADGAIPTSGSNKSKLTASSASSTSDKKSPADAAQAKSKQKSCPEIDGPQTVDVAAQKSQADVPPKSDKSAIAEKPEPEPDQQKPNPIEHLLPPRFDVADPTRIRVSNSEAHKVYLPDGKGGTKSFDQRVLRVEHGGEKISLVALTPRQKLRQRIITNVIAILIAIAALALTFTILSQ